MTPLRILAPSLVALAFVSCAAQKPSPYAAASPAGTAADAPLAPPVNPVYDTPAAYEETGTTAASTTVAAVAAAPAMAAATTAPAAALPKPPSNGAAIIHTVVAGDTLSGISSKYKTPVAAIKQANGMTKDIVVLGRKMVIPPVN